MGASDARRLARTESNYVANQAEMDSYAECGVEKYEFVATLDARTSEVCAALDGKVFPVKEQQPGVNAPPMHPYCRSTTIAYFDDDVMEGLQRRARDPETGKTYLVPADMTYPEWKKSVEEKYGVTQFDVTEEYIKKAVPREGTITWDDGYHEKRHQNEIVTAEWLHETFGGNIKLLRESDDVGVKTADYEWNGSLWELKNVTTAKAADSALRNALKQINGNPGGIILNYGTNEIDLGELKIILKSRIKRSNVDSVDVLIVMKNNQFKVMRYKKEALPPPPIRAEGSLYLYYSTLNDYLQ